jgi:hypothetical protein
LVGLAREVLRIEPPASEYGKHRRGQESLSGRFVPPSGRKSVVNPDHLVTAVARLKRHGADRAVNSWGRPATDDNRHPLVVIRAIWIRLHSLSSSIVASSNLKRSVKFAKLYNVCAIHVPRQYVNKDL